MSWRTTFVEGPRIEGDENPKTFNWEEILVTAKKNTRIPAIFENAMENLGFWNNVLLEALINASAGSVPRANENMIREPFRAPPEIRAILWVLRVNPHGRKKVNAPIKNGIRLFCEDLTPKAFFITDVGSDI